MLPVRSLLLTVVVLLAGCGSSDVNSRPAAVPFTGELTESFMGHWISEANDHLYFGPIDPNRNRGSFTMIQGGRPERPFYHEYEIVDRTESGITLRLHFATTKTSEERVHQVDEEEQTLTIISHPKYLDSPITTKYMRVDDAISPDA